MTDNISNPASKLNELMQRPGIIKMLGAHDVLTAVLVEQCGFDSVFIGGFGTSASLYGLPDLNFLGMTEMVDATRRMTHRFSIPVIADADTGHGDLHNIMRCVGEFEGAGAAGIILEDQVIGKNFLYNLPVLGCLNFSCIELSHNISLQRRVKLKIISYRLQRRTYQKKVMRK